MLLRSIVQSGQMVVERMLRSGPVFDWRRRCGWFGKLSVMLLDMTDSVIGYRWHVGPERGRHPESCPSEI